MEKRKLDMQEIVDRSKAVVENKAASDEEV
jgi:hypothetical protein